MPRKARISAAMVSLMGGGERHAWTLEELHAGLARGGRSTDFSSVFRAAEKLAADGIARRLLLDDGRARFELVSAHHDHLYCTSCHALVPVPCVIEREDFAALERATGVAILDHHLVLSGGVAFPGMADLAVSTPLRVHNLHTLGLPFVVLLFTVVGVGATILFTATRAWRRQLLPENGTSLPLKP